MNLDVEVHRAFYIYNDQGRLTSIRHDDGSEAEVITAEDGRSYTASHPDGSVEHCTWGENGSTTWTVFADGTQSTKRRLFYLPRESSADRAADIPGSRRLRQERTLMHRNFEPGKTAFYYGEPTIPAWAHSDGSVSGVINGRDGTSYITKYRDGSVGYRTWDAQGSLTRTVYADGTETTERVTYSQWEELKAQQVAADAEKATRVQEMLGGEDQAS